MEANSMLAIIRETVIDNATLFGFEYLGKDGNVDPIYNEKSGNHFLLFYDGYEIVVPSFEDVLSAPFVHGHALIEICSEISITDN